MNACRNFLLVLLLLLAGAAQSQVLVYSGTLKVTTIGRQATVTNTMPMTMILDLSAEHDPSDNITLLMMQENMTVLRCMNMTEVFGLYAASGSKSKAYTVVFFHEVNLENGHYEINTFVVQGLNKTIKLGKNAGTTVYAPSLTGPFAYVYAVADEAERELEKGTLTLRLQTKETQIANQPDSGGASPGYLVTVARQKEILANKYKLAANQICVDN